MRVSFVQIFRMHPDGSLEPIRRIRIGGVEVGPGVRFGQGVSFGGIDLTKYTRNDFEVTTEEDLWVIQGIYPDA